ncbi:DUF3100 domain-containing protein [Microvirga sp. W0021]|uniref:DUF3100 domain-containing protein n=1 Tax=Hohaiivirga grylli TaxID=3133970 RepID=A0ABV0BJW5_9HYPH
MDMLRDWRVHFLCLAIVLVSELIGKLHYGFIVLLPMLYAMLFGGIISWPSFKILSEKNMKAATGVMSAALMLLVVKLGLDIGPKLGILKGASLALIMQEIGHFLGTILLGLPIAVALGMGREAVGATYSVAREPNIAIIDDKYGLDSPEGRGVMATYIMGTLFGAITVGFLASIVAYFNIFHPYSLAMGAGVGSGSMMAAAVGSIVAIYPEEATNIQAYAGAANLMSSVLGIYVYMFFSLPFAAKMYVVFSKMMGKKVEPETVLVEKA